MKIIITAPRGKMGKMVAKVASERSDVEILAGMGVKGREYIGKDIGLVAGLGKEVGAPVLGAFGAVTQKTEGMSVIDACDIIVDFSTVKFSMEVLDEAVKHNKALLLGTTGFTFFQLEKIEAASKEIPILFAANTSLMVSVMKQIVADTAKALVDKVDMEIIDMHDALKVDMPSGTAKELAAVIKSASGKEIGSSAFHSIRAGDIPSSHTVVFGGIGERIEITHHSYNWECYAAGACDALRFLYGKEPGLYSMGDVR